MTEEKPKEEDKKKTKPCCQKKDHKLIKISDLPLYGNPYPRCDRVINQELGYIESGVKTVREEITPYLSGLSTVSERGTQILRTAYEHSKSTYEMISSEGNNVAKAAAITGGGLIGLLLASRKGFFKKLIYTTTGVAAGTAASYPKETKELSEIGFFIIKTKGPELIKEYTGVDLSRKKESPKFKGEPKTIETIGQEVSDVHYYGFRVSDLSPPKSESKTNPTNIQTNRSEVKGDFGMSRKEDRDLYANRSSK